MNIKSALLGLALLFSGVAANAANVAIDVNENSVTLAGHDVVAYFTENKPVEGSPEYSAVYNDAIYQFSNAANRDAFKANPVKYAPKYGGFCAYGTALGKKFAVDGQAFKVVDGVLYVQKNLEVYDVWKQDIPGNITKAESNWDGIQDVPAGEL